MGENLSRDIEIIYLEDSDIPVEAEGETVENIEAEIVDGEKDPDPEQMAQTVNQNVNNPVVINITMNQSGDGRQFGYIGEYHEKGED